VTTHRIRAVLFDVDGTLYRQNLLRLLMGLELLTMPLGRPAKAVRRWRALQAFRRSQEHLRTSNGHGAALARQQAQAASVASGLPLAEVEALVDEWMQQRPLKYLRWCKAAGLEALLTRLEARRVRVGVLSDYPALAKLRALGLDGRFDPILCATDMDIGALKPSPRGYLKACEMWNVKPEDVLYVGDRVDVDAAGAAAAGMQCAIVSTRPVTVPGVDCAIFPSFERLSGVFDDR
jgi:HAD superfamily hydrolase (TIGR01509 family)